MNTIINLDSDEKVEMKSHQDYSTVMEVHKAHLIWSLSHLTNKPTSKTQDRDMLNKVSSNPSELAFKLNADSSPPTRSPLFAPNNPSLKPSLLTSFPPILWPPPPKLRPTFTPVKKTAVPSPSIKRTLAPTPQLTFQPTDATSLTPTIIEIHRSAI
jgi:hypothetical protein